VIYTRSLLQRTLPAGILRDGKAPYVQNSQSTVPQQDKASHKSDTLAIASFFTYVYFKNKPALPLSKTSELLTSVKEDSVSLCAKVMQSGNDGLSCHTVSTINTLRAFYEKGVREGDKAITENVRLKRLVDHDTNSEVKHKLFNLLKQVMPQTYAALKQDGYTSNKGSTLLIPHIIHQYVFGTPIESTYTHKGYNAKDIHKVLLALKQGEIGQLGGTHWKGGHIVSLIGIEEGEATSFQNMMTALKEGKTISEAQSKQVILLIHDQLSSDNPVQRLGLNEITHPANTAHWFNLRIASTSPYNFEKSMESTLNQATSLQEATLYSDEFHNRLTELGDLIFEV
jgi:hypothetical protein